MNFSPLWRKWIGSCLSPGRKSILINGPPAKEFNVTCGLRQSDPLSSILFLIAMEALDVVKSNNIFKGVQPSINRLHVSHLFFADDALIVGSFSNSNTFNLRRILKCYKRASGLRINFNKSTVFVLSWSKLNHIRCCLSFTLPSWIIKLHLSRSAC